MVIFETVLCLLFGATLLSALARRMRIPYPTLLAVAGALLVFVPGVPRLDLPPELILALFVAPVLLDAAHDTPRRDLRANWVPLVSLVVVAVGLTTVAVAVAARLLLPGMPWAAAIALGALLAPSDAVTALAVLEQVRPPYRIRKVLEGESLLNDASALLIYKLAVAAVATGRFSVAGAFPAFALVVFGSALVGRLLAWLVGLLLERIEDAPTAVILQFVVAFGVWLLAERLGLSAVVTIVVFGLARAQRTTLRMSARLRVSSFAIWESATFVLNVMAFTLIGLQLGPILEASGGADRLRLLGDAAAILAVVIAVRVAWVMAHNVVARWLFLALSPRRAARRARPAAPGSADRARGRLVGHARYRDPRRRHGPAGGVPRPRFHPADRLRRRAGDVADPGPHAATAPDVPPPAHG